MPGTEKTSAPEPAGDTPIVIDLGKRSRKRVRELRRGEGPLLTDVNAAIKELQTAGTMSASAQPVIVIVRQKSRSLGKIFPFR